MTLTRMSGVSFFALWRSNLGISTLGDKKAAPCKSTTAMPNWMNKKSIGNSGDEFKTALLLRGRRVGEHATGI